MSIKELFEWLKRHNSTVSFGFKKKEPYIALKWGKARVRYKLGKLGELEAALAELMASGIKKGEGSSAQPTG